MVTIFKFRKFILMLLCMLPIVLRNGEVIGNWTTLFLALIPILILIALFNLDIELGVAIDFEDGKEEASKLSAITKQTFSFVSVVLFGLFLLIFTDIPISISAFISTFLTVVMTIVM